MALSVPLSTVSGTLTRIGLGKLSRLESPEPPNRYERRWPGELIHIDVKKLGRIGRGAGHRVSGNRGPGQRSRGAGWEFVHVCVETPLAWPTSRYSPTRKPEQPPRVLHLGLNATSGSDSVGWSFGSDSFVPRGAFFDLIVMHEEMPITKRLVLSALDVARGATAGLARYPGGRQRGQRKAAKMLASTERRLGSPCGPLPLAAVLLRSRSPRGSPKTHKCRLQRQRFSRILQGHRIKSSSGRQDRVGFPMRLLDPLRSFRGPHSERMPSITCVCRDGCIAGTN
jgi:hypothetical protein